jgi:hypothetical protein
VLMRMFRSQREITEDGKNYINSSFITCTLRHITVTKSGRIIWLGHVARIGRMVNVHKISVGKSEEKRQLGSPRRRW